MRVLFVASECVPFAKLGGLGDVVGALPRALFELGDDVRIVIPRYGFIDPARAKRHPEPLGVPLGAGEAWCSVLESRLPGSAVPIYFLEHDALFGGPGVYDGSGLHGLARFILLCRGALMLCRHLAFTPDIIHVHDWPSAPLPVLLSTVEAKPPFLQTATVLTIHNIAHQPRFPKGGLDLLQTGGDVFRSDGLEDHGQLNLLKGGLYHATMLTAVSPNYAREIRTPEGGAGLHEVMRFRAGDLVGVLNGIDDQVWDPLRDPLLPARFSADDLSGKRRCKSALQEELGLARRPEIPLCGVVSRWTHQKGTDLIWAALERILALDVQLVMLGSGDADLEARLRHRSDLNDGRFCAWVGYNETLAHRIEAASDLFLMPSRFEPCGLNQLYSQRYGALPVVRATGGLDDTVEQCDPASGAGTGFKFWELSADALLGTVRWAAQIFREDPLFFAAMQRRSMNKRLGWDVSAHRYQEVYRWALERKAHGPGG